MKRSYWKALSNARRKVRAKHPKLTLFGCKLDRFIARDKAFRNAVRRAAREGETTWPGLYSGALRVIQFH